MSHTNNNSCNNGNTAAPTTTTTSMGDMFRQRRATAAAAAASGTLGVETRSTTATAATTTTTSSNSSNNNAQQQQQQQQPPKKKSFMEIQQEQQQEQQQQQQQKQSRSSTPKLLTTTSNSRKQQALPQPNRFTSSGGGSDSVHSNNNNYNNNNNNHRDSNAAPAPSSAQHGGKHDNSGGRQRHPRSTATPTTTGGGQKSKTTAAASTTDRILASYPMEQGCICSLKDSFGFIYCADRDDQVFFHYSEVIHGGTPTTTTTVPAPQPLPGTSAAESLRVDDEVEFRIGPSPLSSSSTTTTTTPQQQQQRRRGEDAGGTPVLETKKLAAYRVRVLPAGTVQWEVPECHGRRVRGWVERRAAFAATSSSGGKMDHNSNDSSSTTLEGTIRLLKRTDEIQQENEKLEDVLMAEGPLIRFCAAEYQPDRNAGASSAPAGSQQQQLCRGDMIECFVVRERRTGFLYAKNITMLRSERDRAREEAERRCLESAVVEHGVVTSLKGEYGFLKSSARRERIYFHYSSIDLDEADFDGDRNNDEDDDDSNNKLVLREGQDMKFLVVEEEDGEGRPRRRISARRVQMQPRGSVVFNDVVCRGVTGTVVQVPQCIDSAHLLEHHGKVLLDEPVSVKRYDANGPMEPAEMEVITEVYLSTDDSPGGRFSCRGGSSVGMWIQVGDTLLFDVVQDYSDGACRAAPTTFLTPAKQAGPDGVVNESGGNVASSTVPVATTTALSCDDGDGNDVAPAVRLIAVTLAGRAEGVVGALKEAYGFVTFAERPVDVHFKMHQILPDELQEDLRRNMGLSNVDDKGLPLRLDVGVQVQFDISVHGTIHSNSLAGGGRSRRQQPAANERENLKAQRILFLPPNTFSHFVTLAERVKGVVSKQEATQPYVGNVELEVPVRPMPTARHPLIAKMIESYLEKATAVSGEVPPLTYHDIQSSREDEVIVKLLEIIGKGKLTYSHIAQADETNYPGRLSIRKAAKDEGNGQDSEVTAGTRKAVYTEARVGPDNEKADTVEETKSSEETERSDNKGNNIGSPPTKKTSKQKLIKSIRYDKKSLGEKLKKDAPLGVDDVVVCDVTLCRRTGQLHLENMTIVERHVEEVTILSETSATGIVKEVVPARNFGFISVVDESASTNEMIFFHLKNTANESDEGATETNVLTFRKGDAVKFDVGTEKNGKRVAMNVTLLSRGSLPIKADKNACLGLVLLQPSHTSLKNIPLRKTASSSSQNSDKSGRWDTVSEDRTKRAAAEPNTALGCILLTNDPSGMFNRKLGDLIGEEADGEVKNTNEEMSSVNTHLRYKNGALAIHGAGSSSVGDASTKSPRRGDLVSFVRAKGGIRDVRIVSRGAATMIRGRLEEICLQNDDGSDGSDVKGKAKFVTDNDKTTYEVKLSEVVSCDPSVLKDNEAVEGILHENHIYGLARTVDLYLESKLGVGHKERPKLNLAVKKDLGGKIMAQSMMAKGPDDTTGFATGWTTRSSRFVANNNGQPAATSVTTELKVDAASFTPAGGVLPGLS